MNSLKRGTFFVQGPPEMAVFGCPIDLFDCWRIIMGMKEITDFNNLTEKEKEKLIDEFLSKQPFTYFIPLKYKLLIVIIFIGGLLFNWQVTLGVTAFLGVMLYLAWFTE